jgi:aerobic carbon-monoxide dehydrogenase small subunit
MKINFTVNGAVYERDLPPMKRLLDVLREDLQLTGTKEGCGEGECGACSVIIDNVVVNACLIPVCQVHNAQILTIEGLAADGQLQPLQAAFIEYSAAQCGICIPGMLMAAQAFLQQHPHPTRQAIREAIAGNLCRCTGYMKIVDAIEAATVTERR